MRDREDGLASFLRHETQHFHLIAFRIDERTFQPIRLKDGSVRHGNHLRHKDVFPRFFPMNSFCGSDQPDKRAGVKDTVETLSFPVII